MTKVGRILFVLIFAWGLVIAWRRLGEQQVPLAEVAATGALFLGALVGLFLLLLGLGKLLGWLTRR